MDTKLGPVTGLAARQHGVVARRQLIELGVSADRVKGMVGAGVLHPIHRGVYAVGLPRISIEGRWMAATLASGPSSFLSHGPAGQLLGILDRRQRLALHVSTAGRSGRSPAGIVIHRPRSLPACDTTLKLGIPVTTGTRTVWDLATTLPSSQTRRAFEQAEKLRLLNRDRLGLLLNSTPNHPGAGTLRELLAERALPFEATRSRLEEIVLETCRDHDLPIPAVNVPLLGWEVDFLWPDARLVVEADGGDHLSRAQRDRDNERDAVLARAGYFVRRYSWNSLADRRRVATEIATIMRERAA